MSINSLKIAKNNNLKKKTDRQKAQERKTLEGVLVNNYKNEMNDTIKLESSQNKASFKNDEIEYSFNAKKALTPLVLGTAGIFGTMGLISIIVKKSASKMLVSKPQECLPDLALNMNIRQEPQLAMYRMLRDPNTKNIIGFGAIMAFSAMTAVAKSFTDGIKKIWIKNREADIQRDLQENLIAVETKSFSGKLDVIRNKLSKTSQHFRNVLEKDRISANKNISENIVDIYKYFKDKNGKVPFSGNVDKKNNKKKNTGLIYGALGLATLAFGVLMDKISIDNLKKTTKIANDFANNYAENTINTIEALAKKGNKDDISKVKVLLQSIYATPDFIKDTLKKFNVSEDEIPKFIQEITTEAKSIFSDAPTALGGIPKKIQYYCYMDEERGHLYNWIINPKNKFTKYVFLGFAAVSSVSYIGKQLIDAIQNVVVQKEYSNTELSLAKRLVDVEIANFKAKKDSAIEPLIKDFENAVKEGKSEQELFEMTENILFEIKNGPPYVYS